MSHTPGPWRTDGDPPKWVVSAAARFARIVIAEAIYDPTRPDDVANAVANARLIAAAPDLLTALKWIKEVMNDIATEQCEAGINVEYWNRTSGYGWRVADHVSKVIAKAEGRA